MLQAYAGRDGQATVRETQEMERMSRLDFHTFVMAKKNIFDKRNKKVENGNIN